MKNPRSDITRWLQFLTEGTAQEIHWLAGGIALNFEHFGDRYPEVPEHLASALTLIEQEERELQDRLREMFIRPLRATAPSPTKPEIQPDAGDRSIAALQAILESAHASTLLRADLCFVEANRFDAHSRFLLKTQACVIQGIIAPEIGRARQRLAEILLSTGADTPLAKESTGQCGESVSARSSDTTCDLPRLRALFREHLPERRAHPDHFLDSL